MIAAHAPPHNLSELMKALVSLLKHKNVKDEFESNVKNLLQTRYFQTTSSGRQALYIALKSLGIDKGDEVIIPAFTTDIVPLIIRETGATVIPADVTLNDYNIDLNSIANCISPKTKAVVGIHTFGCPCDIAGIKNICNEYDIFFIENAAQAFGAKYKGKYVSTFGDIGITSFGFGKSLSMGAGGGIVCSNDDLFKKIKFKPMKSKTSIDVFMKVIGSIVASKPSMYGLIGSRIKDDMVSHQYNYYRDEIKTQYDIPKISYALGMQELRSNIIEKRREIARGYSKFLEMIDSVSPPVEDSDKYSVYTRYFARVESETKRNKIYDKMKKLKIEPLTPNSGYPISPSLYPSKFKKKSPNAYILSKTLFAIPVSTQIPKNILDKILNT